VYRNIDYIASAIRWSSQPVHKLWPYPVFMVLHAARISVAFRGATRRSPSSLSWGQDLAGYLLMCWGGSLAVNLILGLPAPQLVSPTPWIVYPSVHILFSLLFHFLPLPRPQTLDTILPSVDALTRSFPITLAVDAVRTHPNPLIRQSFVAQLVVSAWASAGGSILATTLGVSNPQWQLATPSILAGGAGILPSTDVWAGILAGLTYGICTLSHPHYAKALMDLGLRSELDKPLFSPLQAQAAVVVVLSFLYLWKATVTNQIGKPQSGPSKSAARSPKARARAVENRKTK